MKILILTHYYLPEIGAPQARLSEMAAAWREAGHDVRVVTCFPNHPDGIIPEKYRDIYKKRRFMEEVVRGIPVTRCWVYATPNKGFVKKTLGHISFMISSVVQARTRVKGCDIIVVSSPTFFSVMSAWFLSRRYKIPYIFDVRDLWPAIFIELGVLKNRFLIGVLETIELFLYRHAAAVVPVTDSFADAIAARGIARSKISVVKNGADLDFFTPRPPDTTLREKIGLTGKFIVLYIGAHGISHALAKIVDAARQLDDTPDIHLLFVGEGAEKARVVAYAQEIGVTNMTFLPGRPKEMVPAFYSIADAGLVPLRNIPLFDTFIPSKMFEFMAMRVPIVASVRGEARTILQSSEAALICDPEESSAIADHCRTLYRRKELRTKLGNNGRTFVKREYDRRSLASQYLAILNRCIPAATIVK